MWGRRMTYVILRPHIGDPVCLGIYDGIEFHLPVFDRQDRGRLDGVMAGVVGDPAGDCLELDLLQGVLHLGRVIRTGILDASQQDIGGVVRQGSQGIRNFRLSLVVLVLGFTIGWNKVLPFISTNNVQNIQTACTTACSTNNQYDYCTFPRTLKASDLPQENGQAIKQKDGTCQFFSTAAGYEKYAIAACPGITCPA